MYNACRFCHGGLGLNIAVEARGVFTRKNAARGADARKAQVQRMIGAGLIARVNLAAEPTAELVLA